MKRRGVPQFVCSLGLALVLETPRSWGQQREKREQKNRCTKEKEKSDSEAQRPELPEKKTTKAKAALYIHYQQYYNNNLKNGSLVINCTDERDR